MADLGELLDAELSAGLADFSPDASSLDVGHLIAPGLSRRDSLTELAELLSGTSNKATRAYKSARRQAERWSPSERMAARGIKPRMPTLTSQQRLRIARRQQNDRLRVYRQRGADMRLRISWYASRTSEWLPPRRWVHIPRSVMRELLRSWATGIRGDLDRAARLLFETWLDRYNVPNPDDWLRDVEIIELVLRPGGET